jgi:hypothetical protein
MCRLALPSGETDEALGAFGSFARFRIEVHRDVSLPMLIMCLIRDGHVILYLGIRAGGRRLQGFVQRQCSLIRPDKIMEMGKLNGHGMFRGMISRYKR